MNNSLIPNTSAIPNVLFDYWMDKLSPAEFKVLMCIARKTYGWHKDVDKISIKQIEKMTGLSRKGIIKNIEVLMLHNLLIKIKSKTEDGDDAPNKYTINVNCMGVGSELSTLGVVNSVHQGGSVLSTPTKERLNTKDNLQNIYPPIPPLEEAAPPDAAKAADEKITDSQKPKRTKIPSDFSPTVKQLAEKIVNALHQANPDWLIPKNLFHVMTQIHEMLVNEKRDPSRVFDVFMWAINDHFWAKNLAKPNPAKYLREKFSQLAGAMDAKPAPKVRKFAASSNDQAAIEKMEEMSKRAL